MLGSTSMNPGVQGSGLLHVNDVSYGLNSSKGVIWGIRIRI